MPAILNKIYNNTKSLVLNKKFLIILFIIFVFLGVALYVYNTYIAPKINPDFVPNREFTTDGDDNEDKIANIYFFGVKWCPFSKKAKPIWESVKKTFHNTTINNYLINFIELDGDEDETQINMFEDTYLKPNGKNIDGYPSIWLVKDTTAAEYAAKPNKDNLQEFIKSII
jgi:hypothetical protein